MADESLFSIQDAYALAEARAVDVFCIKLYKIGGLSVARKISAIADACGIQINCGGLAVASQFEAAASAQFCASVRAKKTFGAAEFVFGLNTIAQDPLSAGSDFKIRDGAVMVPTGPGLGLTLDEKALEKLTLKQVGRHAKALTAPLLQCCVASVASRSCNARRTVAGVSRGATDLMKSSVNERR